MGVSWSGLASGIERGVGLGLALDQNQQAKEDRIYTRGLQERQMALTEEANTRSAEQFRQNQKLTRLQLDLARDEVKNNKVLKLANEVQMIAWQGKNDPKGYLAQMQANRQLASHHQRVIGQFYNLRLAANADDPRPRKFDSVQDMGPGRWAVMANVTNPDGSTVVAPLTANGSANPDDRVEIWDAERLGMEATALIALTEQARVRAGDTGPIDRMRAGAEKQAEYAREDQLLAKKQQNALALQNAKGVATGEQYKGTTFADQRMMGNDINDRIKQNLGGTFDGDQWSFADADKAEQAQVAGLVAEELYGFDFQHKDALTPRSAAFYADLGLKISKAQPSAKDKAAIEADLDAKLDAFGMNAQANFFDQYGMTVDDYRQQQLGAAGQRQAQRLLAAHKARAQQAIDQAGAGSRQTQGVPTGATNQPNATAQPPSNWKAPAAAKPYLKTITAAEQANNLPPGLLGRLLQQESSFNPKAVGPKTKDGQAQGIAQIMEKWHPDVDPSDPNASIAYGAKYLGELYQQFGNWPEALGAYNWGPKNVREKGLVNAPAETRQYVAKIMGDMGDMGGGAAQGPARIADDTEFDALAPGARYVGPDGKERIKPGQAPSSTSAAAPAASATLPGIADAAAADAPLPETRGLVTPPVAPDAPAKGLAPPTDPLAGFKLPATIAPTHTGPRQGTGKAPASPPRKMATATEQAVHLVQKAIRTKDLRLLEGNRNRLRASEIEMARKSGMLTQAEQATLDALMRAYR